MKQNIRLYKLKEDKVAELEQYVEDEHNQEIINNFNDEGYNNKSMKFSLNNGENMKRLVTNKTVPWKNIIYGTRREALDVQVKI
ncbi:MAG: hypothetical protein EZS28_042178 [Streblomastix strix]|uniref:Uncharacterized protein n=1 Tax=Streblomastix strix TaxID=222440 RepID=A0A5J4TY19_9EUKA|nr:MAG: hypothetical protein EZS28_042178 [Streblomastix strix]